MDLGDIMEDAGVMYCNTSIARTWEVNGVKRSQRQIRALTFS
jgi:hypothetical protein